MRMVLKWSGTIQHLDKTGSFLKKIYNCAMLKIKPDNMNTKIISIAGLLVIAGLLFGFHQKTPTENTQIKKGMIKVTILYPNSDGKKFNMDYYSNKHMPMVASL